MPEIAQSYRDPTSETRHFTGRKFKIKFGIRISKGETLIDSIFLAFNVICVLSLMTGRWGLGVPCALIIVLTLIINKQSIWILGKDKLFAAFIIFCIYSLVLYIYSGRSIVVYLSAISYNLISSLLYLIGAVQAQKRKFEYICKKVFNACIFVMGFGLFFYVFFSDFYYAHIGQPLETYAWGINDYRFGSYLTSLILGSLCVASIPLFFATKNERSLVANILTLMVLLTALVMCMQRSAWVSTVVVSAGIFLTSHHKTAKSFKYLCLVLLLILMIYVLRNIIFTTAQLNYFSSRMSKLTLRGMFGERVEQWKNAIAAFVNFPFGYGLGAYGNKAGQFGYECVYDGNYFRILAEMGIIGSTLFLLLLLRAFYRTYKNHNIYLFFLLIGFCMQAIGTNVFDLFFCSYIFWFFLGFCTYYHRISQERKSEKNIICSECKLELDLSAPSDHCDEVK